jgi:hypothetical protein
MVISWATVEVLVDCFHHIAGSSTGLSNVDNLAAFERFGFTEGEKIVVECDESPVVSSASNNCSGSESASRFCPRVV